MWLAHALDSNAHIFASRVALKEGNKTITYQELSRRTSALGGYFRSVGVKQGDRVAVLSKNSIETIEIFLTCYKFGFVFVPLNYRLQPDKLANILKDCGASVFVISREYADIVHVCTQQNPIDLVIVTQEPFGELQFYNELVSKEKTISISGCMINDSTPAAIIYTSGTTGIPKGVVLTHRALLEVVKNFILELGVEPSDRTLNIMPLFHSGGHAWALAHLCRGATGVVMADFRSKDVLAVMDRDRITTVHFVPTMIAMLLEEGINQKYDFSFVKIILYAGSTMPLPVLKKAMEIFGAAKLAQMYGQTEHGPLITYLSPQEHVLAVEQKSNKQTRNLLKSCGRPVFNVQVRIMKGDKEAPRGEIGEVTARGESMMAGYWQRPHLTEKKIVNGWLYTGDLGKMDENGYVYIIDRKEDMIITGGENVYPTEIESIIYEHPAVAEVAVVGQPDEVWGERIVAVINLQKGVDLTEEEFIKWCHPRVERYAMPRRVCFVDSLPKTASGKILRKEVRDMIV